MDAEALFLGYLISGLIFGFICMAIASGRGMSGGFLWGLFFGIIGVIIVAVRPNEQKGSSTVTSSIIVPDESRIVNRFVCRSCGEKSTGWYQKCPKCGAEGKMERLPKDEIVANQSSITPETRSLGTSKYNRVVNEGRWICPNCGKDHSSYEFSCSCGTNRSDIGRIDITERNDRIIEQASISEEKAIDSVRTVPDEQVKKEEKDWRAVHEELRSWKQLLEESIITQDEFETKKKQLLGL